MTNNKETRIKNLELQILELERQVNAEKNSPMTLISQGGKTVWRDGKIDEATFIETIQKILEVKISNKEAFLYQGMYEGIENLEFSKRKNSLSEVIKEFRKVAIKLANEEIEKLKAD